jgi:hypothetical protein
LQLKAENNYYTSLEDFIDDLFMVYKNVWKNREELFPLDSTMIDPEKHILNLYLTASFVESIKCINFTHRDFQELFDKDIKAVLDSNKLPKINCTFKNIPVKKEYQTISEYDHIFPHITKEKIKTSLKPKCAGDCCENYEDLGPLNLEKSRWDSKCCDRENNLECNPEFCGCTAESCKNQAISRRIEKVLGKDVVEKYAWGIDLFTYRNLIEFLPLNFTDEYKAENYIEKTLIKALSDLDTKGYSIKNTVKYLVEKLKKEPEACTSIDYYFSLHLLNVFKFSKIAKSQSSTSYSKGIGIFCRKKEGIKKNELISIYLGEIYPPWYWYEKQDLIKKNKLDKELPDFYNIMLERLKCDEKGYDLVMVDPNSKGNFASRMSHSCMPNCNTVLMCSKEEYSIGMFATKEINYGDELTFDYNSVTEKEKEFQDAICLCSSFSCRGHYLIYSNSVLFTEVLSKYHTFLHRNAILLNACSTNFENNQRKELLPIDNELLKKYSIGSSALDKAPFWLKKWTSLILRYVDLETKLLPKMLMKKPEDISSESYKKEINDLMQEKQRDNNSFIKDSINIADNIIINKSVVSSSNDYSNSNGNLKKTPSKDKKNSTKETLTSASKDKKSYYNFKDCYVYDMKKYTSSTRGKKVDERSTTNITNITSTEDLEKEVKMIRNGEGSGFDKSEKMDIDDNGYMSDKEKFEKILSADIAFKNPIDKIEMLENKILEEKKEEFDNNLDSLDKLGNLDNLNNKNIKNEKISLRCIDQQVINDVIMKETEINDVKNEEEKKIDLTDQNIIRKENQNKITGEHPLATTQLPETENADYKFHVNGITENRIQNIAITLDKVIHVLNLMKTNEPPLIQLSEQEVYEHYWGKEDSIRSSLDTNIKNLLKINDPVLSSVKNHFEKIQQILKWPHSYIPEMISSKFIIQVAQLSEEDYKLKNQEVREKMKAIALLIKACQYLDTSNKYIFYEGLADMLFLYSSTRTYFKSNKYYESCNSEKISIRRRDINTNSPGKDLDAPVCSGEKSYDKLYIWGQLIGWFKQTVKKILKKLLG